MPPTATRQWGGVFIVGAGGHAGVQLVDREQTRADRFGGVPPAVSAPHCAGCVGAERAEVREILAHLMPRARSTER
jgi:hypothetical protein